MKYRELEPFEDEYVRLVRPKWLKTYRHQNSRVFHTPKRDEKAGITQAIRIDYPVSDLMVESVKSFVTLPMDRDDGVLRIKTIREPDTSSDVGYTERVSSIVNLHLGETKYHWDWIRGTDDALMYIEIEASGFFDEDEPVWREVLDSIVTLQ